MQRVFSPWRFSYVSRGKDDGGCVFCSIGAADAERDAELFVLHRAEHNFVVLNIYPYTTGHLMVVPYLHRDRLSGLPSVALTEMAELSARVERLLLDEYRAEGINLGMNLGRCAGAGIADHLHLHAVPRWCGDTNFMTVTGDTRVLPEDLGETWRKLRGKL